MTRQQFARAARRALDKLGCRDGRVILTDEEEGVSFAFKGRFEGDRVRIVAAVNGGPHDSLQRMGVLDQIRAHYVRERVRSAHLTVEVRP